MSADELSLRLPAQVDAGAAASLYREWHGRVGALAAIDMQDVRSIDSAGVALVRQLQDESRAARGSVAVLHNCPAGYLQICRAHRLAADGE